MRRALVVKALTGQIILVRTDDGNLVSLSVPCRSLTPGTMLRLKPVGEGCFVIDVVGRDCDEICDRKVHAVVIEHKDYASSKPELNNKESRRDVI